MACIKRVEKQQEFLKRKGKDMLWRGLKTMDELEEAEDKEKRDKENKERARLSAAAIAPTELPYSDLSAIDPALVLD